MFSYKSTFHCLPRYVSPICLTSYNCPQKPLFWIVITAGSNIHAASIASLHAKQHTHTHTQVHSCIVWLTQSTSFSCSASAGKYLWILSWTQSRSSVLGPSTASPSAGGGMGLRGTGKRLPSSSLIRSAAGPEPARTSQGVAFLRDASILWAREHTQRVSVGSQSLL